MDLHEFPRISINPAVCHGKPVIAGTRVMVWQIVSALGSGETRESLLENYPTIKPEDIDAALVFAGRLAAFEEVA
jgi:uncharacterized protein (DUF433 family)